jgi:hypothetical protein
LVGIFAEGGALTGKEVILGSSLALDGLCLA